MAGPKATRVEATFNWDPAFAGGRDQGRAALLKLSARLLESATAYAPKASGALRGSGYVVQDEGRAIIAFDAPYAVIVHEMVGARFQEGRAKFLETAAMEIERRMEGEIGSAIASKLL